jgi:hypothetical protein
MRVSMMLRAVLVASFLLVSGPSFAAGMTFAAPAKMAVAPMVFYLVKGAVDSCGRGCDSWIEAEGQIDSGAAARFRKFLARVKGRDLPIYFFSPGGNLDQALAMGTMLRERSATARVARTVLQECGFEAQDSEVCLKLKQSGREIHGDLETRGAICNSACPYLILGATTREIAPDTTLAVHSPKVIVQFTGGKPSRETLTAATERGRERAGRLLASYFKRMGAEPALLALASTIKFEDAHVLTREEIARFGIDRREQSETAWRVEGGGRAMIQKIAAQKNEGNPSYRVLQWRMVCFNADQFELDFQRPAEFASALPAVLISNGGSTSLHFRSRPFISQGFELRNLYLSRVTLQTFADAAKIEVVETSQDPLGRRLMRSTQLSSDGLANAIDRLLLTCPPPKHVAFGAHESAASK